MMAPHFSNCHRCQAIISDRPYGREIREAHLMSTTLPECDIPVHGCHLMMHTPTPVLSTLIISDCNT